MSSYIPRDLIGHVRDENANWGLTTRPAMFPFLADYTNRNTGEHAGGLAVPSMIQEPMNALARLIGTPSQPGTFTQGPDYGSNADDMRTLLETFLGGNTTRGAGAVEKGAVREALPSPPPPVPLPQMEYPMASNVGSYPPIRAYHGTTNEIKGQFLPSEFGTFGPSFYAATDGPIGQWTGPEFADHFARTPGGGNYHGSLSEYPDGAQIFPLDIRANLAPHETYLNASVNAPGLSAKDRSMHAISALRDQGFDGSYFNGEIGLWNRGTVTSPFTGETLFSDQLPSPWGSALQGQQNQPYPNSLFGF